MACSSACGRWLGLLLESTRITSTVIARQAAHIDEAAIGALSKAALRAAQAVIAPSRYSAFAAKLAEAQGECARRLELIERWQKSTAISRDCMLVPA